MESLADAATVGAMKDTDFYQQILGLVAPWKVAEVRLEMEARRVTVRAAVVCGRPPLTQARREMYMSLGSV